MRDPDVAQITESEVRPPPLPRRGPCLICGEWSDADTGDDVYAITLDDGREAVERVAHRACVRRVAHSSAQLPAAGETGSAQTVPDNYLASKFRTPSGR